MSVAVGDLLFLKRPPLFLVGVMASSFLLGVAVASTPYVVRVAITLGVEVAAKAVIRVVTYGVSAIGTALYPFETNYDNNDDDHSGENQSTDEGANRSCLTTNLGVCHSRMPSSHSDSDTYFLDIEQGFSARDWILDGQPCMGVGFFPIYPSDEVHNHTGVLFSAANVVPMPPISSSPPISISPPVPRMRRCVTPSFEIQSVSSDCSDMSITHAYSDPPPSFLFFTDTTDPILYDTNETTPFLTHPSSEPLPHSHLVLSDNPPLPLVIRPPLRSPDPCQSPVSDLTEEEVTIESSEDETGVFDDEIDTESVWSVVSSSNAISDGDN